MRIKKLLILLAFLMVCNVCFGEVYLLINSETKEVVSMSPEDDAVMEKGQEKVILPGELIDYPIQYHPIYYFYKNGRFVTNIEKLSEEAIRQEQEAKRIEEEKLIEKKIRELAIKELEKEGYEFEYIKKGE